MTLVRANPVSAPVESDAGRERFSRNVRLGWTLLAASCALGGLAFGHRPVTNPVDALLRAQSWVFDQYDYLGAIFGASLLGGAGLSRLLRR